MHLQASCRQARSVSQINGTKGDHPRVIYIIHRAIPRAISLSSTVYLSCTSTNDSRSPAVFAHSDACAHQPTSTPSAPTTSFPLSTRKVKGGGEKTMWARAKSLTRGGQDKRISLSNGAEHMDAFLGTTSSSLALVDRPPPAAFGLGPLELSNIRLRRAGFPEGVRLREALLDEPFRGALRSVCSRRGERASSSRAQLGTKRVKSRPGH